MRLRSKLRNHDSLSLTVNNVVQVCDFHPFQQPRHNIVGKMIIILWLHGIFNVNLYRVKQCLRVSRTDVETFCRHTRT